MTLALTWNSTAMYSSPDPNTFITVDWLIEARLEDLQAGGSVPPGLELIPMASG